MKKKKFILFLVLTLLLTASCTQTPQKKVINKQGKASSLFEVGDIEKIKITASKTNVRSGFSSNFPTVGTLNKNDKVDVVDKMGDWYVVRLNNNQVGTIFEKDAKPIVEEDTDTREQPVIKTNLTSLEKEMLTLVNKERSKNNLSALIADPKLTKVARIKSQDMIDNDYFSHYSPTYGSPTDMMKKYGIKYVYAGENIAANTTVQRAHNSLMGSTGHRKNILNSNFTHIGIGIKKGGPSRYIFTQMFISKPK